MHAAPTVTGEGTRVFDKHHHADPLHEKTFTFVQGYGKLCSSNPHIHVAELFGEEPELLTRTVVPSVDPDVRAVFTCLRVLDVEHESVFVCDCPIGFHPRAGKPYRLRRLTADQEYRRANRVDLVYGMLLQCHPTAMRRGVSGFRVAKHLHLPITRDKQAETAGWERYDAHVGERTERFWDGLIRRRVVLLSAAGELDVAIDRDDASDAT